MDQSGTGRRQTMTYVIASRVGRQNLPLESFASLHSALHPKLTKAANHGHLLIGRQIFERYERLINKTMCILNLPKETRG